MRVAAVVASLSILIASGCSSNTSATLRRQLELDHLFIVVAEGAPERSALQAVGLNVSAQTYRHNGQGTASVVVLFRNTYLELLWRDHTVTVAPGLERFAEQMVRRQEWKTSRVAPFGIGLRRRPGARLDLPFKVDSYHADWMRPGDAIDVITGTDTAVITFVVPPSIAFDEQRVRKMMESSPEFAATLRHGIGAARVTNARFVLPRPMYPNFASTFSAAGLVQIQKGDSAVLELTLDDGRQHREHDFRPVLPLVVKY